VSGAYDLAYCSIKDWIVQGELKPGQRLEINGIGTVLKVSTSPVREALSSLAMEGMVEAVRGTGFRIPACDLAATTDLLDWRQYLSDASVRAGPTPATNLLEMHAPDHASRTSRFFDALASRSKNNEVRRAMGNANDRLHHFHRLESRVLPDAASELIALEAALHARDRELRQLLHRYHRHRIAALPAILKLIRDDGINMPDPRKS